MATLRAEIDALDTLLVTLVGQRAALVERAIELKPAEGLPARIPARVEQVLENVRSKAEAAGVSPELVTRVWHEMIEFFIAREEEVLGKEKPA